MSAAAGQGMDRGHARKMDQVYRYQRHIYDLTRKYYLLGRDRAILKLHVPTHGSLLEVACGTGRNLMCAQKLYPNSELFGLDISAEMLAQATRNFRGRPRQPQMQIADATAFTAQEFGKEGFDRILISYALSMIPDWEDAVACSLKALNSGGSLHIVDFGQQEDLPRRFRSILHGWLMRFHVSPRANMREVLARQAERANAKLEFTPLYRGYAWHAILQKGIAS
ncbi:S-adenosylmethionine-diacylgycerolhomoserine-N-methyltransferase [Agrobacterium vitis]|nr:S-adenosylmethionine-diacylgycerolhomoserine-N-methyltransferase [Agrobacterium vitis]MBE1437802.1 S-adenosylmethionine-diacylgycerolhomoserine-N-methyltransferase [Agrobacterium vitis]